ncbi:MAG TPA: ribonuclease P protein component [bacterium]|nr:ribonuclease P protein component [bacterium]
MVTRQRKFTLTKAEILSGRDNFKEIFEKGKLIHGQFTIVFYFPANGKKVGFVVSKTEKKAVRRNRLKRMMREIYRLNKSKFPDGFHYALLAKGTCDDYYCLEKEILNLVGKI